MQCELTKSGIPCLWECCIDDVSYIICNHAGNPKIPIKINLNNKQKHALIPIAVHDIIIKATYKDKPYVVIYEITKIKDNEIKTRILSEYKDGKWTKEFPSRKYADPILAARLKAKIKNQYYPFYIRHVDKNRN